MVELETIVSTLRRQLTWSHIGDKFDIEDLLKERLQKGRERLKDALESIEALCETVDPSMVHLMERHHNEQFLYYMDTYLPNWKQLKSELNKLPVSHADWNY